MLTADTGNKYTTVSAIIHIQREKGKKLKGGGDYTQIISERRVYK